MDKGLVHSANPLWQDPFPPKGRSRYSGGERWRSLPNYLQNAVANILRVQKPEILNIEEITKRKWDYIREVTIVAPSMNPHSIEKILTKVKKLHGLHLIFTQSGSEKLINKFIKPELKQLSLVGLDLMDIALSPLLKKNKLTEINLSDALGMPKELASILSNHHLTLETIILEKNSTFVTQKVIKVLESLKWPNLKVMSFDGTRVSGKSNKLILKNLGPSLKILKLDGLTPQDLDHLSKNSPYLTDLFTKLSKKFSAPEIRIPDQVKNLKLGVFYPKENKVQIKFPKKLRRLILFGNIVGKRFDEIGDSLNSEISELAITDWKGTSEELSNLFGKLKNSKLRYLSFPGSGLTDEDLAYIIKNTPNLRGLNVSNNLVSNKSVEKIVKLKSLESLNIGGNVLTNSGLKALLQNASINKNLREFYYENSLEFDSKQFIDNMPKNLEVLWIPEVLLRDDDVIDLLEKTPEKLRVLNCSTVLDRSDSTKEFLRKLPPNLEDIGSLSLSEQTLGLQEFVSHLPRTLYNMEIQGYLDPLAQILPQFPPTLLKSINLVSIPKASKKAALQKSANSALSNMVARIPPSIRTLYFNVVNIDKLSMVQMLKWPRRHKWIEWNLQRYDKIPKAGEYLWFRFDQKHVIQALNQNPRMIVGYNFATGDKKVMRPNPVYHKDPLLVVFITSGPGFDDDFVKFFERYNLEELRHLVINNSNLTGDGIVRILRSLPDEIARIDLSSNKIQLKDVDKIIESLPRNLGELKVSGLSIGQRGYQKFRDWQKRQKALHDFEPNLDE